MIFLTFRHCFKLLKMYKQRNVGCYSQEVLGRTLTIIILTFSTQVHFDTKPEIIVIKPHVILAGRLNFKFSVGKSLNPEDKCNYLAVHAYIHVRIFY